MVRRPPRSTRTDTRFPYTTLFRSRMRAALAEPRNMEIFARPGVGSGTLIRDLGIPQDFSGCYVLLDAGVAIYVGISRGVIGRLRQHAFGKMHFDARSEEHTSELQSLMRISYAVLCLKKNNIS